MAGLVDKFKRIWDSPDDEYDDNYDDEYDDYDNISEINTEKEEPVEYHYKREPVQQAPVSPQKNKVVSISATAKLQVVLFKPEHFGEDTTGIADELIKMHTVVLNLENTPKDVSRRILDFLSGCAYANNGKIKRIATSTFIVIPNNVDLTGDDLLDELENSGVYF